jgi:hypothetical protein
MTMHCVTDIDPDHTHDLPDRQRLIERLNRARHEITCLEQELARLQEDGPVRADNHPADTPLPIAAG